MYPCVASATCTRTKSPPPNTAQSCTSAQHICHSQELTTGPHLELQHQIHAVLAERADVVENQSCDDVDAVGFMSHNAGLTEAVGDASESGWPCTPHPLTQLLHRHHCHHEAAHLVLVAWALAVLCEGLQGLDDEAHVVLVDVEPQQPQPSCRAAAHDVQELEGLTYQVVVGLVVLTAQEVLWSTGRVGMARQSYHQEDISASGFARDAGEALTWRSRLWFSHSSCRKRRIGRMMSTAAPISLPCTRSPISCPRCKLRPSE